MILLLLSVLATQCVHNHGTDEAALECRLRPAQPRQPSAMWLFLIDPSWSALRELYLSDTAPYWIRYLQDRFSLANFDSTSQGGDEGM